VCVWCVCVVCVCGVCVVCVCGVCVWCVCDLETSTLRRPRLKFGLMRRRGKEHGIPIIKNVSGVHVNCPQ